MTGGAPLRRPDTDGDGMIDSLDTDSDNDKIPDSQEGRDFSLQATGKLQTAVRGTGAFEPLQIKRPVGTFLDALYPRPVSGCAAEVSQRIAEAVFLALVQAIPDKVTAAPAMLTRKARRENVLRCLTLLIGGNLLRLRSGPFDRVADADVGHATAQVAGHDGVDVLIGRGRKVFDK